MKHLGKLLVLAGLLVIVSPSAEAANVSLSASCASAATKHVLLMHGGSLSRPNISIAGKRKKALARILKKGEAALAKGATAVEVVAYVVSEMEDDGVFNAGSGARPNKAGEKELDASIMEGKTQKAGAVASVRKIKNPILGARYVMEETKNVLFVGPSADRLLKEAGLDTVALRDGVDRVLSELATIHVHEPFGTVGAAVLDKCGNLAAGTSTGGFKTKIPGRVGDSPIIGAGTYANETVAVSATGHGEYFIRYAVAHDIYARMVYGGKNLEDAASATISELKSKGGKGGVIAVDKDGNVAMPYSMRGMVRGIAGAGYDLDVRAY